MQKNELLSAILTQLQQMGIPYQLGNQTDITINASFLDAQWSTGQKQIQYEAMVFLNEAAGTVYMREETVETGKGISFGTDSESSFQTGKTLFRKVKSVQYGPDGKAYEYELNLGDIPKTVKETAKAAGWKFKTVLRKQAAMYPPDYMTTSAPQAEAPPVAPTYETVETPTVAPTYEAVETPPVAPAYETAETPPYAGNDQGYTAQAAPIPPHTAPVQDPNYGMDYQVAPAQPKKKSGAKKGCLIAVAAVAAIFLIIIILALANGGSVEFSTANISEATIAASVDETTMEPLDNTTVFFTNAPIIYASVLVENAPDDTVVTAVWSIDGEEAATSDYTLTEVNQYVAFHLAPAAGAAFPAGDYTVTLYLDGNEEETLEFTVK